MSNEIHTESETALKPVVTIIQPLGDDSAVEQEAANALGVDIDVRGGETREEWLEGARDAEAIMLRLAKIDRDFIEQCPKLKVIGRAGVGTDNIDVEAATEHGIQVINVPDYCIEEVATHTAALILSGWRRLPISNTLGEQDRWWDWDSLFPVRRLSNCTLGLVGAGRIGRAVAESMVGGWFKEVVYYDPWANVGGMRSVELDELFAISDVISLHAPSDPTTAALVNAERLAAMKDDALLINVSRGTLVDEDALLAGLAAGKPSRAALDVLTVEPPAPGHPLLHHPNVQVTNHMAWLSDEALVDVRTLLARRCALALLGENAQTVVNARALEAGPAMSGTPSSLWSDLWSTPVNAPLVPRFPIRYRGVRILSTAYRTQPELIRRLLPPQLEAVSDVVIVHQYVMPDVQAFGKVDEANVMVGARLVDEPDVGGGYTTALFISSDSGLAQGREVHGQPKKLGRTRIRSHGDLMVGTVHRNGIRILRVTTPYKQEPASIEALLEHYDFRTNLNLKLVPNIDGTSGLAQITARRLLNLEITQCWRGRATVEIQANAQAPLHELPVVEALDSFYWEADFELGPGTILRPVERYAVDPDARDALAAEGGGAR